MLCFVRGLIQILILLETFQVNKIPASYSICLFSTHLQPFIQSQNGSIGKEVLAGKLFSREEPRPLESDSNVGLIQEWSHLA